MIINTAGEYTLQYTATDACGNSTTVERELTVLPPPRTVLYTDGTFIINERPQDIDANIQAHGQPTNVYAPLDSNNPYVFGSKNAVLWYANATNILNVKIGSPIHPTNTANWFYGLHNVKSIDTTNLDTSNVTSMTSMFRECWELTSLDLSNFDTSNVTTMDYMFAECSIIDMLDVSGFDTSNVVNMYYMFQYCRAITTLDLSGFNTNSVTNIGGMFQLCGNLKTIYSSAKFVTTQATNSSNMFASCSSLVGGAGTTYNANNPKDKTYAHIDGGTSDPGYFTAKS